jgi:6-phosphofructokinase
MGRNAGWIALNAAVAGGAEICLLPEFPYDIEKVMERIDQRFDKGRGFVNVVIAEGARNIKGEITGSKSKEIGYENVKLGGVGFRFEEELKQAGCEHSIRTTVLGHLQRGGIPIAYDRVLATQYGVKAFELALAGEYGRMVSYRHPHITSVTLKEAIQKPNLVEPDTALMKTARGVGMCFGD